MRPHIVNGQVELHAPLPHPERMAAGIADISDCELRLDFRPWPIGKLALNFLGLAGVFGLLWML